MLSLLKRQPNRRNGGILWNMVILLDFLSDLPPLTDRKRFFFFSVEGGANSKACKYLISLLNSRRPSSLTLPNFFPSLMTSSPFSVRELDSGVFHSLLLQSWFIFPLPQWCFLLLPWSEGRELSWVSRSCKGESAGFVDVCLF